MPVPQDAPKREDGGGAQRLASIDVLRAVAVLLVMCNHLPFSWRGLGDSSSATLAFSSQVLRLSAYGAYGVHLFLVISGFCIHMRWATGAPLDFGTFWRRRLRRLYPPYALALLGSVVLTLVSARVIAGSGWLGAVGYASVGAFAVDLVLLVLLAQNFTRASWKVGNGPFWTLALEEQLYMLYFPLLSLRRRFGWPTALATVTLVTLAWRAIHLSGLTPDFWLFVGPARWFEWTLGAFAVEVHVGRVKVPRWFTSPATVTALLGLAVASTPTTFHGLASPTTSQAISDPLFGVGFFALVCWLSRVEREGKLPITGVVKALGAVGVMSYSLYLTHNPTMIVLKQIAVSLGVRSAPAVLALRLVGSLAMGFAFFALIESRFLTANRPRPAQPSRAGENT